MAKPNIIY